MLEGKSQLIGAMPSFMLIGGAQPLWHPPGATYLKIAGHPPELFDRQIDPTQLSTLPGTGEQNYSRALEKELQRQIKEVDISASQLPASSGDVKRKGSPSAGARPASN